MKEEYINKIYDLALESFECNEIPVGAIIVKNNKIVGVGVNTRHCKKSVVGHAEINAIEDACRNINDWRLENCVMYVTLLPCMMCSGAILESRIEKVYYLCDRTNVRFDTLSVLNAEKLNDDVILEKYLNLLRLFFQNKRN